jgi:nicotinate-nucleotide pyrophosphorylase (carboxylating)
VNHNWDQ